MPSCFKPQNLQAMETKCDAYDNVSHTPNSIGTLHNFHARIQPDTRGLFVWLICIVEYLDTLARFTNIS